MLDQTTQQVLQDKGLQELYMTLSHHPEGIKEYDLLEILKPRDSLESGSVAAKNLALFQKHFLLFHSLYQMRDILLSNKCANVEITPLSIKLLQYVKGENQIGEVDALREYYLDLNNLETTTEDTVDELLNSFWEMYIRNDNRAEALAILGLSDPVGEVEVLNAYRRLVMEHHPDRGGDKSVFQSINKAYTTLAK